jgi:hypothetical protein
MAVHKAKSVKEIKVSMGCCIEGVGIQTSKKLYEREPLWLTSVLGEEYLSSVLDDIGINSKVKKRILNVVYNNE